MNRTSSLRASLSLGVLALCPAGLLLGQSSSPAPTPAPATTPASTAPLAPASAPATSSTEGIVTLSPFTVNTSRDVGFVAATSLAGGRLNSDLADTPAAYSVETSEFLDAVNITDLKQATKWTVNSNLEPDNGSNQLFANQISGQNGAGYLVSFRGVIGGQQQIDFFPAYYDYDAYNLDRIDFARGPNAILFGNGSFGGTPNAVLKQAETAKAFQQLTVQYGSWGNVRTTLDVNQPINRQLAARVNFLYADGDTWRDREFNKKLAGTIGLTYNPWAHTQFHLTGESGDLKSNLALATTVDSISGWDGKTTFSAPISTLQANAASVGIARNGSATTPYIVYIPGERNLGLVNWANSGATLGGDSSAGVTPVGGVIVPGVSTNYSGGPVIDAFDASPTIFNNAIGGSQFRIPNREFSNATNGPDFKEQYDNYTAGLTQQVGDHLFLGGAANYSSGDMTTDYTQVRGLGTVFIDINQNLPTGAANPNFLVPYSESTRYLNITNFIAHNYRVNAAWLNQHTPIGDFRLNTEVGLQEYSTPRAQYTYVIQDPGVDPRLWASTELIRYRYYWNNYSRPENNLGSIAYTNPINGTTSTVPTGFVLDDTRPGNSSDTLARFKYAQAVLGAKLFDGKLDLLVSGRRDGFDLVTLSSLAYNGYGYGASYNGETIAYKPVGPANYFSLPTSRPTLSNGFPNLTTAPFPAYQSDYSTPHVTGDTNTYDAGAVFHVTDWFGVFADKSSTYNPPTAAARINGGVFAPLLSSGWDAGFRLSFFDSRLVITATQYAANQTNVALPTGTQSLPFAIPGTLNSIINLTPLGDPVATDINKEGLAPVIAVYSDTATAHTQGREVEAVGTPLPGWRVSANVAFPVATQSNAFADSRAYIAANTATLVKILNDGGVTVTNNVATVNPAIPANQFASATAASAAATAFNNLQVINADFVTGAQKQTRLADYTANLFTDYTVQSGPAKGLRFGGGANWYGKEVIGFHGGDTVANPANPLVAIPDPQANAYNPVYRGGYALATGVLGYTYRLNENYTVVFNLTIDNLFNNSKPIYYNTAQEAPGGNLTTSARVATPYLFSYLNPRNYTLSATIRF
jgi:outer membrane receptor protein involved in Fe transport